MALGLVLAGMLLVLCPCVFALDPALDVSQYAHTAWKLRDGFSRGVISCIAQTSDGYLWLGSEFGLLRFDGVRVVPWQPPPDQHLPDGRIFTLLAAPDGTLWIGTARGLASWKNGKLTSYAELAGQSINSLLEDREGTVWAGGMAFPPPGKLCAIRAGTFRCSGEDGMFGNGIASLYEESKGNLWAGSLTGLWRWQPGPPKFYPIPDQSNGISALGEDDDGTLLVCLRGGIHRFVDEKLEMAYPFPASVQQFNVFKMLRDRDGGLWAGMLGGGLLHVHQGRTDLFTRSDGLSGNTVHGRPFEDREGNIWVPTASGLDRFHGTTVAALSTDQGLSNNLVTSIIAAKDGSVWVGTFDGLNRLQNGQITIYRNRGTQRLHNAPAASGSGIRDGDPTAPRNVREINNSGLPRHGVMCLFQDDRERIWLATRAGVGYMQNDRFTSIRGVPGGEMFGIAGDSAGNIWVNNSQGLFHLRDERVAEAIPWTKLGRNVQAGPMFLDPRQGGLWLGFAQDGVAYVVDGQLRASYGPADGLGAGAVSQLQPDRDGALWAATQGGLSRLKDGHVTTLSRKNGLPCDAVHWMMEDDDLSVWLYTACGLVRIPRTDLDGWARDPSRQVQATLFDSSDGVVMLSNIGGYSPHAAKPADGKLWFKTSDGLTILDPKHLALNKLPPPVHIERITADGEVYDPTRGPLPPLVRNVTIDYTALSLVAPEKIHFRYKLEGQDKDWREVINNRAAQYTNLEPKHYRFLLKACNNSGVWNEAGDTLEFSIAPAFYQSNWFRLSCAIAFLAMLWALLQLRLRRVAREFNVRMEARVNERLRIARELHDTMLQSFQGAVLHFQVAADLISKRPQEAKQKLESALDLADHALAEGRDAVEGLRSSTTVTNDIAAAMITLGKGLAASETNQNCPEFRVDVVGATRDLHPITRDEICRIAGEAVRNAFKHAQASRIEVEIQYDPRRLRLRIRDDGRGIESHAAGDKGREGHYGLPGMRERAKLIGGNLELWSKVHAGTEIELTIPAAAAYAKSAGEQRARFFRKGAGAD